MTPDDRIHFMRNTGALHVHVDEHGDWYAVRHDGRDMNPQSDPWLLHLVIGLALVVGVAAVMLAIGHALMPSVR